jgi:hypothetical protein
MKIIACIGFMILGIIINCGGVPTDHRGYIGARYWYGHILTKYQRWSTNTTSGITPTPLSSTVSMGSVPSSSRLHLLLAVPNLQASQRRRRRILGKRSHEPRDRLSGGYASSTSSTYSSLVLLYPRTARSMIGEEVKVATRPL